MKKRLSLILAIALIVSMIPFAAFANDGDAGEGDGQQTEITSQNEQSEQGEQVEQGEQTEQGDQGEQGQQAQAEQPSTQQTQPAQNSQPAKFYGWKTIDGAKYWADSNGNIAKSPRYIKGTKKVKVYYNKKKKKWQTKKIKKAKTKYKTVTTNYLYMFGTDGKLITKKGLFTYNGKEYYGLGGGVLKTKWAAIGKNAMYFNPSNGKTGTVGSMAKNCTIGHLKVPANGRLGEAYALGVKELDRIGWNLKAAYKFSYKIKYRSRWYRRSTAEQYAIRGFKKRNGNCFVMASTFYIMAKLLGYDVHQVKGKVAYVAPHSWTVIVTNGKQRVYDPNFKNETGRNGWNIYYGKKGTWRYTGYRWMN